ncbi:MULTISPECIES: 5-(carboxyamino)imidazole ribonucleotide synthase [Corynebacterium]|uniref:5-(carboxyamino)imidazole ribonucleotide synthase n=1 Tax=Corynebacterium TaxID=1716 RepID=UPI001CE444D3|nr:MULTISPECIES: 5-(carboxyamino)imidazole ribonucleotide synthase [Corynebacterium]
MTTPPLVTIIGDGQLARMMHQAAIELGVTSRVLAGAPDSSAAQVTGQVEIGDYTQWEDVNAVSQGADAVTFDHEHVPNEFLDGLIEQGLNVQPQPTALINAQDKLVMRKRLRELGMPVPPFMEITSVEDAREFHRATQGNVCLKARRGGYDGKGVWFPDSEEDTAELVAELLDKGTPLMAEKKVQLVRELSAMVARRPSGETVAWPVVESVQEDGICVEAIAPADNPSRAAELAVSIAEELGVTGALAVELFETRDEAGQPEIIVNELAMRPHNTGHWTQDGCVTSQFEQHIRAVLDRPLGSTAMLAPHTVMSNVLGADFEPDTPIDARMDAVWRRFPQAKIHMYGKGWRPRRKMGHVNVTGESVEDIRRIARLCSHYIVTEQWADGWSE